MESSLLVVVVADSLPLETNIMNFVHQNIGNFEFVNGGFELSVSWGFLVGIGGMYLLAKYVLFRQRKVAK